MGRFNQCFLKTGSCTVQEPVFLLFVRRHGFVQTVPCNFSKSLLYYYNSPIEITETEEHYISKCESLPDMERIKNLQYHMILDYADQVRKLKQCGGSQSRLVRDVLQYIRSHMAEPIRTADIAAYCGKSRGGLTTEFKKQTGRTLSDFIQQQKMQEAETLLLKTEQNLSQISSLLGFSSQSHFTRVFKEVHGMTPTEFRKSQG